ncbi:MAG: c-type cytochrome [Acetobacteraceae bacterium]|nr:c-type cytochrome [Acetobacteraceae bacterium]
MTTFVAPILAGKALLELAGQAWRHVGNPSAAAAQHRRLTPERLRPCASSRPFVLSLARWDFSLANTRQHFLALAIMAAVLGMGRPRADEAGAAIAANGTPAGLAACASCHGAKGEGNADTGFPRLAGLAAPYIQSQLAAFASGRRENPIMTPLAKMLNAAETEAVADYYANLPGAALRKGTPAPSGDGAIIALEGSWSKNIPPCVACHGPDGIGVSPDFPPLAGQPAAYLQAQLEAWQQGKRPPGPLGVMEAIAKRLSPAEAKAVADWFASLTQGTSE